MLANAGGPAWQMHLLPQKMDKLTYVGTVTILFASSNVIKVPAFATLGYLTWDNLLVGSALLPVGGRHQLPRDMAGAPHAGRVVFPHRLRADVPDRDRADPRLDRRPVVAMTSCHAWNRVALRAHPRFNRHPGMTIITDPLFYLFAVPAVIMLGLSKGGFSGIGMVATPLLALLLPPLEAAAILLPIILLQDAMSCWVYRRVWDPWNLKVMLPGAVVGVAAAWLFAAYVSEAMIRLSVGLIALGFALNSWLRRNRARSDRASPRPAMAWCGAGLPPSPRRWCRSADRPISRSCCRSVWRRCCSSERRCGSSRWST